MRGFDAGSSKQHRSPDSVPLLRHDYHDREDEHASPELGMADHTQLAPEKHLSTDSTGVNEVASSEVSTEVAFDTHGTPKVPWWSWIWDYDPGRSKEETHFVQRLDVGVLTILSLGYFIKNLDQTNISNAYISGMKEDLAMNANQLNLIDVAWTSGYVIGQIPSQIVLTKVRPSIWIPSCELVWTILTFSLAAATTSHQVIAIRFFVGLAESIFYPAAHMILGSWYKPSELAKRACVFHASSAAASMFSGYLQAGVYKGLNGVHGLPGWKWLFIMDGVISTPIAIAGMFLIPDLPENTRAFYLSIEQRALARKRMSDVGRAPRTRLGRSAWKRIFGRWHVYALVVLYIIFINTGPSSSVNPFSLWLKASKKYSIELINIIPTTQSAVQLVTTVGFAIFSDHWRNRPAIMSVSTFFGLFYSIVLAIWSVPSGLKWFAFEISRAAVPYGPISMSWANEICGGDAEERAIVLGLMNAMGYAFNAWLPYLTYPAVSAPRFTKGFIFSSCAFVAQFGITWLVWWLQRRETRKKLAQLE
ncbi:hypothetical protein B0A48_16442 [Cryoendolithus antarcticus]|uniref:Major facilitator superfamily (MFS) profile domain-containing protein n=1 Tax=Cryoendolithus antarcticus TaxID=1507870 RepID=A0A1V8SEJ4_9PEZI|nr:hypothetical protein B0A48_16442 [Cryoendolithus antarcticus]